MLVGTLSLFGDPGPFAPVSQRSLASSSWPALMASLQWKDQNLDIRAGEGSRLWGGIEGDCPRC